MSEEIFAGKSLDDLKKMKEALLKQMTDQKKQEENERKNFDGGEIAQQIHDKLVALPRWKHDIVLSSLREKFKASYPSQPRTKAKTERKKK